MLTFGSFRQPRYSLWVLTITISILLIWVCAVQFTTLTHTLLSASTAYHKPSPSFPSTREYISTGYLLVSSNGGLNQMRSGICDMVAIARYLNVTLIVPELDNGSYWNDQSSFREIFDQEYFINSLRDEIQILRELPLDLKKRFPIDSAVSIAPVSWSNMSYYYNKILPLIKQHKVVHMTKTDARLANNGLPLEIQTLRCRVNYKAMRFTREIEKIGKKIVTTLRKKGPFMVLHLRYEMDMLAFTGCTHGCTDKEADELKKMRYSIPWWREKDIDSERKRQSGLCPLTPEETALVLRALNFSSDIQIYIAAGDIYGGERRLSGLREHYPNLMKKESLLPDSVLEQLQNHSNRMAAVDYFVSLASDVFVMSFRDGHMAKLVEGHRRFLGYKATVNLNQSVIVNLIDNYRNGKMKWEEFSRMVKTSHADRLGGPVRRIRIPNKPKLEDYFYMNPEECLPNRQEVFGQPP